MTQIVRVVSYNLHKGFRVANLGFVLREIGLALRRLHADVVLVQESVGEHRRWRGKIPGWPDASQHHFLAAEVWPHVSYGRNAVHRQGHHGNAILSRFPLSFHENIDISTNLMESRGCLHAVAEVSGRQVHFLNTHLSLFERGRLTQARAVGRRVAGRIPPDVPLVLAGDFNDWRGTAGQILEREFGLREAHAQRHGELAKTFPGAFPMARLDRVYQRGLEVVDARVLRGLPWVFLSDHLPLLVEFRLPAQGRRG